MIVTMEEVKPFLKLEPDFLEDDPYIWLLITASENYLYNATGQTFDETNNLAKLYCLVLISDWYTNRGYMQDGKVSDKVRYTIQSIQLQLKYCYVEDGGAS